MEATLPNMTTAITIPQVDFKLLKELANRFGWIIQTEKKSGIEEALDDVKAGRIYHAENAHDLIEKVFVMKYSVDYTNRFKKSLRKSVKRGLDPSLIETAVDILATDGKLPASYKPHKLHGNLEGIWECHILPDWLMLWLQDDDKFTLLLLDNGNHSELLGK